MPVRKLLPSELVWANQRYAEIDFVPSCESDLIAVAELDGIKAGLGRITQVQECVGELGGMLVLPVFRGQSIASHIVDFLLEQSEHTTLFCIPFLHLAHFYQGFGFEPVHETIVVPTKVAEKYQWCQSRYGAPVILLCRTKSED